MISCTWSFKPYTLSIKSWIIFKHSQLFFLLSKQASLPGHSREVKTVVSHLQPIESLSNFDTEKMKSFATSKMVLLSSMKLEQTFLIMLHFLSWKLHISHSILNDPIREVILWLPLWCSGFVVYSFKIHLLLMDLFRWHKWTFPCTRAEPASRRWTIPWSLHRWCRRRSDGWNPPCRTSSSVY